LRPNTKGIVDSVLHLGNDYSLEEFSEIRIGVLVAVAVQCPLVVGGHLTEQFYERNFALGQRFDMLDTIIGAVNELSMICPPTPESLTKRAVIGDGLKSGAGGSKHGGASAGIGSGGSGSASGVPALPAVGGEGVDEDVARREAARQSVARRIEAKTRRWGRARAPPPKQKENKFAEFAGVFFWPLLRQYDRGTPALDLIGRDAMMLGRVRCTFSDRNIFDSTSAGFKINMRVIELCASLVSLSHDFTVNITTSLKVLYTLAVVVHSAGAANVVPPMASALMEVVLTLRVHTDVLVKRAIAFAMVIVLGAVPAELLMMSMAAELREAQLWLEHTYEHNPDAECRGLAVAGLIAIADIGKSMVPTLGDGVRV
jgi:telomere length regulation protein